jgi:hypothetical protein
MCPPISHHAEETTALYGDTNEVTESTSNFAKDLMLIPKYPFCCNQPVWDSSETAKVEPLKAFPTILLAMAGRTVNAIVSALISYTTFLKVLCHIVRVSQNRI